MNTVLCNNLFLFLKGHLRLIYVSGDNNRISRICNITQDHLPFAIAIFHIIREIIIFLTVRCFNISLFYGDLYIVPVFY